MNDEHQSTSDYDQYGVHRINIDKIGSDYKCRITFSMSLPSLWLCDINFYFRTATICILLSLGFSADLNPINYIVIFLHGIYCFVVF